MTATKTAPKELLAEYRHDARVRAAAARTPGDRSVFPGLHLAATGMIYLQGKHLVYKGMAEAPGPVDAARLEAIITREDTSVVVADAQTFSRLQILADTNAADTYKTLKRRLDFSRGLPGSVKLPILTEALAYRYWLPEGKDERSFDDWAEAFDVKGPSMSITMRSLISLAADGKRPDSLKYPKAIQSLASTELALMKQAEYSNLSSDVQLFGLLNSYSAKAGGLRLLDPGLLTMHVLDGQACKIVPMNVAHADFTASVTQPFKLKVGKSVRLTDGTTVVDASLDALRYTEDALHAVFSQPSEAGGGRGMVLTAHKGQAPLYAMEDPFSLHGRGIKNRRWFEKSVEQVTGRDVPLDVILAGAPAD
jgi:hypothetical protein